MSYVIEILFDCILIVTWILPMGAMLGLDHVCKGWNEGGVGSATCSIPLFASFYWGLMDFFFACILMYVWIPIVLIALFAYIGTTYLKMRKFFSKMQPRQKFINNIFGLVVWGVATIIILDFVLQFNS